MATDWCVPNGWVKQNCFITQKQVLEPLPPQDVFKNALPKPFWDGHDDTIACYWKVWELAHRNLKPATSANNFIANYIDTAFNNHVFLWDSVFILMFGRYGSRAFNFQGTMDNFYRNQELDGFIGRELHNDTGKSRWESFDPNATGPNLFAWSEWEYWLNTGDRDRLAAVFPVLAGYHDWTRRWRTWQNGSYWNSGFGAGMDNQPRLSDQNERRHFHGFMSWLDATLQALLSADVLLRMAAVLGCESEMAAVAEERESLVRFVNEKMWDTESAFYYDQLRDGSLLLNVKSIGAYWALLSRAVPADRQNTFIDHLKNPAEFCRPHRVPSLSADHPEYSYDGTGGYWCGGVWPCTNYMVLRGLTRYEENTLAHEIGINHILNVTEIFRKTGTVWEYSSPEGADQGTSAKKDFVGWGGVGPVAVLFEYVFGLRPDIPAGELLWDVRLLERHGVEQYPFGRNGLLDLTCETRKHAADEPVVRVRSTVPVKLRLRWAGGEKVVQLN